MYTMQIMYTFSIIPLPPPYPAHITLYFCTQVILCTIQFWAVTGAASCSLQELGSLFPFAAVWEAILPGLFNAIQSIHSVWDLPRRELDRYGEGKWDGCGFSW